MITASATSKETGIVERALPRLIFPALVTLIIGGAIIALARGYAVSQTLLIFTVLGWASVMLLERVFPHCEYWKSSQHDVGTDCLHVLFSGIIIPRGVHALTLVGLVGVAAWLSATVGLDLWPHETPLVVQLALALLVGDLGLYWWHRFAHEKEILWRLHSVHHSPRRLYFLNAARFHPIDMAVAYTTHYAPLVILGANAEAIMLFTLFTSLHGLLQHANVELKLGWMNWIFSMTELHRWHHSLDVDKANSNYGSNLIVWDVLFGTRFLPDDKEHQPEDVGIDHFSAFPQDYVGQLLAPVHWQQIKADSAHEG
jgi:sterol desaturase/sphingolipid hydroxylase (fatty acid hydroxylase superfamily)